MWLKQELSGFSMKVISERSSVGMRFGMYGRIGRNPSHSKLDQMFRNMIAEPVARHLSKDMDQRVELGFSSLSAPSCRLIVGGQTVGTLLMPNEENHRLFLCLPNGKRQEVYSYVSLRRWLEEICLMPKKEA